MSACRAHCAGTLRQLLRSADQAPDEPHQPILDEELSGHVAALAADGPGIPTEHLPHLFDRFYRTDTSRTRATGGSGLGLAITRHLVEAHGGTVDVSSTAGTGSSFTIRIPVAAPVATG